MRAVIYRRNGGIAVDADGPLEYVVIDEDCDNKDRRLTDMSRNRFNAKISLHEADDFPEGVDHYFDQV